MSLSQKEVLESSGIFKIKEVSESLIYIYIYIYEGESLSKTLLPTTIQTRTRSSLKSLFCTIISHEDSEIHGVKRIKEAIESLVRQLRFLERFSTNLNLLPSLSC